MPSPQDVQGGSADGRRSEDTDAGGLQRLRSVRRRYRTPPLPVLSPRMLDQSASTILAVVIEQVRQARDIGQTPDAVLKNRFIDALDRLIQEAMRPEQGDTTFQAMVLRHRDADVRAYASLAAQAAQDRREVRAAVNAIAHPEKLQRMSADTLREGLAPLPVLADNDDWQGLADCACRLLRGEHAAAPSAMADGLHRLLEGSALQRLQRLMALSVTTPVQHYRSLWSRQGPPAGSALAMKQGVASQQRGAAVEARAARALQVLAAQLNAQYGEHAPYRVITSMRASPALPASAAYAKSEWDAVLLRRSPCDGGPPAFDVLLLVEAKASPDAAATDLPRLLRGLRLLNSAAAQQIYVFESRQGTVRLRGRSLKTLAVDHADLADTVLYCCDAPAESHPRVLSSATRMQLLSAPGSVAHASLRSPPADGNGSELASVWQQLLHCARWETVRQQYPLLCQARGLMVHVDDLVSAMTISAPRQRMR